MFTMACIAVLSILIMPSCKHQPEDLMLPDTTLTLPDTTIVPPPPEVCDTCGVGVISFTEDVLPILQSNCAQPGCHDAATQSEGYNITSYQAIMSTSTLATKGLASKFWKVINENEMPQYPSPPLTSAQKAIIKQWIEQGSQNTTCSHTCGCDSVNVSFAAKLAPIIQTHCVGCHNNSSQQGGVNLSGYANVKAQIDNGKFMKTIKWQTGAGIVAMPLNATKLSDCTIGKFQSWVNAGAPNN